MEIIRIPRIMHDTSKGHLLHGRSIGFVPTMGALHEGHLSLIKRSKAENDIAVVSIFINPLQFGFSEDFHQYPRDTDGDIAKLRKAEADVLFMPDASSIYHEGFATYITVDKISEKLCGAFRPGHFRGVATIVAKLFNIVKPARAYFGQKDFQQTVIIKKMAKDLDMPVDIIVSPTIREHDGLAMSSRNVYMSEEERKAAGVIYGCLIQTSEMIKSGIINKEQIKGFMKEKLSAEPLVREIQYASMYDPETLDEVENAGEEALLAVSVKVGGTRLIDNMLVKA
ncbi:MAG: pantoate--beta-alanine ligase [Nitrospirae bacterium RIFOXYB2_FULL_43_5]|nr:MAG: pantoate--beta-alanine ligase [Nitrospirae bacterium GWF2_44_13]OGW63305.1 MAG: pantoate--beta-alanine ligase [Nitrospirae bacterium RIFOXYA2_FULL_44_9]OGW74251.1 MAG: pantoate--beta-alanine ligase [Nitrospirae bacterium RIFOXYB2_FULL_43_5]HBG92156.1 pantoate--beta-alanine ligase [Nitrospiraceae bacterium]